MKLLFSLVISMVVLCSNAQSGYGSIQGVIYTGDSTETVPFAIVKIEVGDTVIAVKADFDGKYKFNNLRVGIYNLNADTFFGNSSINGIIVDSNEVIMVDVYLDDVELIICGDFCWPPAHGYVRGEERITKFPPANLKIIHVVPIVDLTIAISSDFYINESDDIYARGSRSGDVTFYIDGIKTISNPILPNTSIQNIIYYLGGIPAKYGDTTGEVVIIQTRNYFDLYYEWLAKQY